MKEENYFPPPFGAAIEFVPAAKPARLLALPVLACDGCGDALVAAMASPLCVACVRRAARARRRLKLRERPANYRGEWAQRRARRAVA